MSKRPAPTRPLACHRCRSRRVKVSESQQYRRMRGEKRLCADVRCMACKARWWSRHEQALAGSRAKDRKAARP